MSSSDDTDLREAFRALRDEARRSAPSFSGLTSPEAWRAGRRSRLRRRGALAVLMTAAVTVLALVVVRVPAKPLDYERFTAETGIDLGEVGWQAPSDFLLEIPGADLLRTLPVQDRIPPAPVPDGARLPDTSAPPFRSS